MSSAVWTVGKTTLCEELTYQILDELLPKTVLHLEKAVLSFNPSDYPLLLSKEALEHFRRKANFVLLEENDRFFLQQVIAYGIPIKRVSNAIQNAVLVIDIHHGYQRQRGHTEGDTDTHFAVMEAKHLKTLVSLINGHHWPLAFGAQRQPISSISMHFETKYNPRIVPFLLESVKGISTVPDMFSQTPISFTFSGIGAVSPAQIIKLRDAMNGSPLSREQAIVEATAARELGNQYMPQKDYMEAARHFAIAAHLFGAHIKNFHPEHHQDSHMFMVELWASAIEAQCGLGSLVYAVQLLVQIAHELTRLPQQVSVDLLSRVAKATSCAGDGRSFDIIRGYTTSLQMLDRELYYTNSEEIRLRDLIANEHDPIVRFPLEMSQARISERASHLHTTRDECGTIYQSSLYEKACVCLKNGPFHRFFAFLEPVQKAYQESNNPKLESVLAEGMKTLKASLSTIKDTMLRQRDIKEFYLVKEMLEAEFFSHQSGTGDENKEFEGECLEIFWACVPECAQACIDMHVGTTETKGYLNAVHMLNLAIKKDPGNQKLLAMKEECLTGFKAKAKKNKEDKERKEQEKLAKKNESMGLNESTTE